MRIAIITQPLLKNYGGILQNWALQQVLLKEFPGAQVKTFDQVDNISPLFIRIGSKIKDIIFRRKHNNSSDPFTIFCEENIRKTNKARSLQDLKKFELEFKPDTYIVGSDQVWRPSMVHNLNANFLSFTKCSNKIAYAASFGVSDWEFTRRQTKKCKILAQDFKAISVRESDGLKLCNDYLEVDSIQVLDPTLLLDEYEYKNLMSGNRRNDYIFSYILDTTNQKQKLTKLLCESKFEMNAGFDYNGVPPVKPLSIGEWLRGMANADTVICDSFHGAAFSIIFNKDFVVLENGHRGNSRLRSILDVFGLQTRLITTEKDFNNLKPIDWIEVNEIRKILKTKSLTFLSKAISS